MSGFGVRFLSLGLQSPIRAWFADESAAKAWADSHLMKQATCVPATANIECAPDPAIVAPDPESVALSESVAVTVSGHCTGAVKGPLTFTGTANVNIPGLLKSGAINA